MSTCCICESKGASRDYRVIDGYVLIKCQECGLVYLDNSATDQTAFFKDAAENVDAKDKKVEYWGFPEMYHKYSFVFEEYFGERLSRCMKLKKDIKNMFDIGAGFGFWMNYCRANKLEVKGIDISEEAVKHGRKSLKLDIEKSSLDDFSWGKKYDLYNFCDVLEHLENPNKGLRMIYDAMKPESLLYVQVPDVLGFRIPRNHGLGLPYHRWQFNYRTLRMLLKKNGLEVVKRWSGAQGVIGRYERSEVDLKVKIEWFLAKKLKLGNRLMLICKKVS